MLEHDDRVLRARHSVLGNWILCHNLRRMARRQLQGVYLLNPPPQVPADLPMVLFANHSSWWDGFLCILLNRSRIGRRFYLPMREDQLRRFPFLRRGGTFGMHPTSPKRIRASLEYAVEVLSDTSGPPPVLCIFPQGITLHWSVRPLQFRGGLHWIASHCPRPLALVPMALRVDMLREQRPEAFFRFGDPIVAQPGAPPALQELEDRVAVLMDRAQEEVLEGRKGESLLVGKASYHLTHGRKG